MFVINYNFIIYILAVVLVLIVGVRTTMCCMSISLSELDISLSDTEQSLMLELDRWLILLASALFWLSSGTSECLGEECDRLRL